MPASESSELTPAEPRPGERPLERIVLTGFMGSGKSTIGPLLAHELGWTFLDLDHLIEQRTELSVPQIFATCGEPAFREEETAALGVALTLQNAVIALGGGALDAARNRSLLGDSTGTLIVFLDAPFGALEARCARQAEQGATERPVWAETGVAQARFALRHPLYCQAAHVTVRTTEQSPWQTTASVLLEVTGVSREV